MDSILTQPSAGRVTTLKGSQDARHPRHDGNDNTDIMALSLNGIGVRGSLTK